MKRLFLCIALSVSSFLLACGQEWAALNQAATRLFDEGRILDAKILYEQALGLLTEKDSLAKYTVLQNLASVNYSLGSHSDALNYLDLAVREGRSPEIGHTINLLNTKGNLLMELGRFDEANVVLWEALDLSRGREEEPGLLLNLGALLLNIGKTAEARLCAWETMYISKEPLDSIYAFRLLAISGAKESHPRTASTHMRTAHKVATAHFEPESLDMTQQLCSEAQLLEMLGQYKDASSLYRQVIPLLEKHLGPFHPQTISASYGIAKCASMEGNVSDALDAYLSYADRKVHYLSTETVRLSQDDLRQFWAQSREGIVDAPIYAALAARFRPSILGQLLDIVMLSKGFNRETVRSFRNQISISNDPELDSMYNLLLEKRSNLDYLGKGDDSQLEERIRARLHSLGLLADAQVLPSWQTTASRMSPKSIAIEFTCHDDNQYGAFLYKKGENQPVFLSLPTPPEVEPSRQNGLDSLYSSVWEPLEPYLKGIDTLYFAPAGILHNYPLEVIANPTGTLRRDCHKAVIRLVTTRDIPSVQKQMSFKKIVLFGDMDYQPSLLENLRGTYVLSVDNLDWSAREIDTISTICNKKNWTVQVFRGDDATEEQFRKQNFGKGNNTILFLSTHGLYMDLAMARKMIYYDDNYSEQVLVNNPMLRTAFLFSGANGYWSLFDHDSLNDATITAQEISEMDLRGVSLAILSACQTGLGDLDPEGVYGFQHAFKLAGAGATIVSLWNVEDEATATMMQYFFKELTKGRSPEESLKKASELLKKDSRFSEPKCWAPFVIVR